MKTRLQQLLSLILTFVLLSTMMVLPVEALVRPDTIKVGGVDMSDGDYLIKGATEVTKTEPSDGTYYAYFKIENGVNTLTLNNYEYKGVIKSVIYAPFSLHIILEGENNVSNTSTSPISLQKEEGSYGIFVEGALDITGNGKLTAKGGNAKGKKKSGIQWYLRRG